MQDVPHPRILFQDVPQALRDSLASLAGESMFVDGNATGSIHDSDWDLAVSFSSTPYAGEGVHLLSFGAEKLPSYWEWEQWIWPVRSGTLLARAVQVSSTLQDDELKRLVKRTIVENDPGAGNRKALIRLPAKAVTLATAGAEEAAWAALITYTETLVWALPSETSGHVEWLAYVLRFLHRVDADRFPGEPNWRLKQDWATPMVRKALAALSSIETERVTVLAQLDQREGEAREALERALAAKSPSGLLSEQGGPLVQAITNVLVRLGFGVSDMDDHHDDRTGAKLEDLRVTYPAADGDWTCLVEVKGYGKGAKANDVGQIIGRPPLVFLRENGREADALWHIVNSNREQDPSTRPRALEGGGDLLTLAGAGGCFIDTRDLFRAWRDVEEGASTAEEVCASLMAGRERWEWPAKKPSS
jgi:hypothetical protein